jgi:hypothetical protein
MARLWLPIKEETTGREQLIYIPGASYMDRHQLEEIIAWQEEHTRSQLKALGPKPQARFSRKEVGQALKEFRTWLKERQEGTGNRRYY